MAKDIRDAIGADYPLTTNAMIIEENRRIRDNSPQEVGKYSCHGKYRQTTCVGGVSYCGSTSFRRHECPHEGIKAQLQIEGTTLTGAKKHTCNCKR